VTTWSRWLLWGEQAEWSSQAPVLGMASAQPGAKAWSSPEEPRLLLCSCCLCSCPKGCPNEQVASLCLLSRKIKPTIDSWQVRRAILHFIKDVLSANAQSCSAWDVVGHIFSEFSRTTGRRVRTVGSIFLWRTRAAQGLAQKHRWGHTAAS